MYNRITVVTGPDSPGAVDARYLAPLLSEFRGRAPDIQDIQIAPLKRGTSTARLYAIVVRDRSGGDPARLVLKISAPGDLNETRFYRDLRGEVPLDTPRVLDTRVLDDGRGWLLMEELAGTRDGLTWTVADYRDVVRDMARLHAAFWGRSDALDGCQWLWRPTAEALREQVEGPRDDLAAIEATGFSAVAPEILSPERLSLAARVLARSEDVLRSMLGVGTTLVHGDYWFYNVQVLADGRRVLVDWQECRVWSGVWELAYFTNLLHLTGQSRFSYRKLLPVSEGDVVRWYWEALSESGVSVSRGAWEEALACARIWQPLLHWLPRYKRIAEGAARLPGWPLLKRSRPAVRALFLIAGYGGARALLAATFDRWEGDAQAWLG